MLLGYFIHLLLSIYKQAKKLINNKGDNEKYDKNFGL
jgi:hypothetical protein